MTTTKLTETQFNLFWVLFDDRGNWGETPLLHGNFCAIGKNEAADLRDLDVLKEMGLLTYDSEPTHDPERKSEIDHWVTFTEAGEAWAADPLHRGYDDYVDTFKAPEPPSVKHTTREGWLQAAVAALRPMFEEQGEPLPEKLHVACGWPSTKATAKKQRRIGECWVAGGEDGVPQMYISPVLVEHVEVLGVLVHELVHAVGHRGHKKGFKRLAVALGLTGKMTATEVGEDLQPKLAEIAHKLGPYPHSKLTPSGRPKQSTRMLKCACEECGYTIRLSRKWAELATPNCPLCEITMEMDEPL